MQKIGAIALKVLIKEVSSLISISLSVGFTFRYPEFRSCSI